MRMFTVVAVAAMLAAVIWLLSTNESEREYQQVRVPRTVTTLDPELSNREASGAELAGPIAATERTLAAEVDEPLAQEPQALCTVRGVIADDNDIPIAVGVKIVAASCA